MSHFGPPRAKLICDIPPERYRLIARNAPAPRAGDTLVLDQGFTGPNHEPMVLAYFVGPTGEPLYEAEIKESELGEPL